MGFYNDVAWHVRLGRDKNLFTAPHTAIVVGLFFIFAAAVVGTVIARLDGFDEGLRIRGLRIPWSMLALGLLGGSRHDVEPDAPVDDSRRVLLAACVLARPVRGRRARTRVEVDSWRVRRGGRHDAARLVQRAG
jgi:hypothetical protein